jgi:hypothetical protein
VVEVALHGNQLALAYRRDHAASTGTKVTGGCEFRYFRKFPFLCGCTYRGNV